MYPCRDKEIISNLMRKDAIEESGASAIWIGKEPWPNGVVRGLTALIRQRSRVRVPLDDFDPLTLRDCSGRRSPG